MAGPKRLFVGSLLNLAPGFGLGYLVAVQRRLFRVSLFVWVVAGAVIMVGLAAIPSSSVALVVLRSATRGISNDVVASED